MLLNYCTKKCMYQQQINSLPKLQNPKNVLIRLEIYKYFEHIAIASSLKNIWQWTIRLLLYWEKKIWFWKQGTSYFGSGNYHLGKNYKKMKSINLFRDIGPVFLAWKAKTFDIWLWALHQQNKDLKFWKIYQRSK